MLEAVTTAPTSLQHQVADLPDRHEPVILEGLAGSGRSTALYRRYLALLDRGYPAESILVWTLHEKNDWLHRLSEDRPQPIGKPEIHTFRGWVRHELQRWWPTLEAEGRLPKADVPRHAPTLIAVESAQAFLDRITVDCRAAGQCYDETNLAKPAQIIQVLDALGRAVENRLDLTTVDRRLAAGFAGPESEGRWFDKVACCFDTYRKAVYRHRVFDQAMQLEVYGRLLALPRYRESLGRFKAVLIDNLEETYPIQRPVVELFLKTTPSLVLAFDTNGGLREYLGTDFPGARRLADGIEARLDFTDSFTAPAAMVDFAKRLYQVVLDPDLTLAVPPEAPVPIVIERSPALRSAMIEQAAACVLGAIDNGTSPAEIAVIAPSLDPLLVWALRERFGPRLPLFVHGGGARLVDYRIVRVLLAMAVLAYPAWQRPPRRLDLIELLELTCVPNPMLAHAVQEQLNEAGQGAWPVAPDALDWSRWKWLQEAEEPYRRLYAWLDAWRTDEQAAPVDVFFHRAFGEVLTPSRFYALGPEGGPLDPRQQAELIEEVRQVKQLADVTRTLRKLDELMPPDDGDRRSFGLRLIETLQSGIIAERPFVVERDDARFVHLYTPQSYAERGPAAKLQVWLDLSSPSWYKSDIRPLTNPRVLSVNWDQAPYDAIADERDQATKLARVLLSTLLKAKGRVHLFASQHDAEGRELFGDLPDRIESLLRSV